MTIGKYLDADLRPLLEMPSLGEVTRDNLPDIRDAVQTMQAAMGA